MICQRIPDNGRRSAKKTSDYTDGKTRHADKGSERVQYTMGNVSDAVEMEAVANHFARVEALKIPVRHYILSPEVSDKILTHNDWQKAAEIFLAERNCPPGTLWKMAVHTDGHDGRHPQHAHILIGVYSADGARVPESWDARACKAASARIERELGLTSNASRAGLRRAQVLDANQIQDLARRSRDLRHFRQQLYRRGIRTTVRKHNDGKPYAISFSLDGAAWTPGGQVGEACRFGNLVKQFGEKPLPNVTHHRAQKIMSARAARHAAEALVQGGAAPQTREQQQREREEQQARRAIAALARLFANRPLPQQRSDESFYQRRQRELEASAVLLQRRREEEQAERQRQAQRRNAPGYLRP